MPTAQDGPPESSEVSPLESQNKHILVSTPRCLRLSNLKKAGVQEALRTKFNRIQQGLSKKRDLLVQGASGVTTYEQPTFYIPTPLACLEPELSSNRQHTPELDLEVKPLLARKSSLPIEHNVRASFIDGGSQICDSIPIEPEPDYDDIPLYCASSSAPRRLQQRWSSLIVDESRVCNNLQSFRNIATVDNAKIPKAKLNTNRDKYMLKKTSGPLNADLVSESVEEQCQYVVNNKQISNISQSSLNKQSEQASAGRVYYSFDIFS